MSDEKYFQLLIEYGNKLDRNIVKAKDDVPQTMSLLNQEHPQEWTRNVMETVKLAVEDPVKAVEAVVTLYSAIQYTLMEIADEQAGGPGA